MLSVKGHAKNLSDGRVEFLLQGEKSAVMSVLQKIRSGPSYSQVIEVKTEEVIVGDINNTFNTI